MSLIEARGPSCSKSDDVAAVARSMTSPTSTRLHVPFELAGLDLRQVEHVVDQLGEPLAFADDDLQVVVHLLHRLRDLAVVGRHQREDPILEPLLDDLREAEHRGQRRAQLVADRGEERALGGVGFLGDCARLLGFLEQPPDLVLVLVELPVGVRVVERDARYTTPGSASRSGDARCRRSSRSSGW